MKKILFSALTILMCSFAMAQTNTFPSSGNVGIGTTSPNAKLEIKGDFLRLQESVTGRTLDIYPSSSGVFHRFSSGTTAAGYSFENNTNTLMVINALGNVGIGTTSPTKRLDVNGDTRIGSLTSRNYLKVSSLQWPELRFQTPSNDESIRLGMAHAADSNYGVEVGDFYVWSDLVNQMPLIVRRNGDLSLSLKGGNVGIGTTSPTEKLSVDGNILAKKVRVSVAPADWPDYVFSSDYNLRPLSELEDFIKQNQHLPEVPSANEVETNGQDLGDIQAVLLKKVEELTLYIIDESKAKEELRKENQELKKLLFNLKDELEVLKTKIEK